MTQRGSERSDNQIRLQVTCWIWILCWILSCTFPHSSLAIILLNTLEPLSSLESSTDSLLHLLIMIIRILGSNSTPLFSSPWPPSILAVFSWSPSSDTLPTSACRAYSPRTSWPTVWWDMCGRGHSKPHIYLSNVRGLCIFANLPQRLDVSTKHETHSDHTYEGVEIRWLTLW